MKLTASLRVNGRIECTLDLHPDRSRRRVRNEFSGREWIRSLTLRDGDKLTVTVTDEARTLATFELVRGGGVKAVYHGAQDTGDIYAWANLVEGYDNSKGLTACVMFRKRREVPATGTTVPTGTNPEVAEQQGELFERPFQTW